MTKFQANDRARQLINESIEAALQTKFRWGREEYGGEWVGDELMIEAHSEALDLMNYLALARADRRYDSEAIDELLRQMHSIRIGIRTQARRAGLVSDQ